MSKGIEGNSHGGGAFLFVLLGGDLDTNTVHCVCDLFFFASEWKEQLSQRKIWTE